MKTPNQVRPKSKAAASETQAPKPARKTGVANPTPAGGGDDRDPDRPDLAGQDDQIVTALLYDTEGYEMERLVFRSDTLRRTSEVSGELFGEFIQSSVNNRLLALENSGRRKRAFADLHDQIRAATALLLVIARERDLEHSQEGTADDQAGLVLASENQIRQLRSAFYAADDAATAAAPVVKGGAQ